MNTHANEINIFISFFLIINLIFFSGCGISKNKAVPVGHEIIPSEYLKSDSKFIQENADGLPKFYYWINNRMKNDTLFRIELICQKAFRGGHKELENVTFKDEIIVAGLQKQEGIMELNSKNITIDPQYYLWEMNIYTDRNKIYSSKQIFPKKELLELEKLP